MNFEIGANSVVAAIFHFLLNQLNFWCGNYSKKKSIQRQKLLKEIGYSNWKLFYFFSNDVSGGPVATVDVYELSDNYDDNVFDLPFKPDNNIKRKMSDPELSLMHTVASSSSTDLDCIIGGVQFNAETGKDHI